MHTADDSFDGVVYSPADQFRHDLKTPLTTIYARAHLLARSIRRSPTLSAEEQVTMLAGVTTIEAAVREMTTRIDAMGRESPDGSGDLG
jgi:signal transduction histidine kinase